MPKDDDAAFAANAETIRRGHDAKIQATKDAIDLWVAATARPGNGGTITLALLELGIERHLEHFPDEKSATDLVQGVLRKVLRRQRGPMHNDRRPAPKLLGRGSIPRPSATPAIRRERMGR
jgi:hypothetical protein